MFAYFLMSSITGLKVFRWHYLESQVEAIYDSACSSSFDHLNDVVIFGDIWIPYSWKIIDTIEPRFADSRLLHLPNTETSFLRTVLFFPGKSPYRFSKLNQNLSNPIFRATRAIDRSYSYVLAHTY